MPPNSYRASLCFSSSLPEMIQPLESIQKGLQEIDAELPIRRVLLVEGASESNFAQTIQMNSTVMNFDFSVFVYSGKGGRDASVLESDSLRGMLKSAEFAELRRRLRTTTIPRVEALRREQESNHSYGEDPDHMSPFLDALSAFEKLFRQSRGLVKKIRHTRKRVREWISQREPADPDSRTPRELSRPGTS